MHAVWDGRFQPFQLGHVSVIKAILARFDVPLVIFIIQSTVERPDAPYTAQVNVHHSLDRNPLTLWERYEMIHAAIAADFPDRPVTVLGIPRPDVYWDIARNFYPRRRFICITDKDDYERSKARFWTALGERVEVVPVGDLPDVSSTRVKQLIKSNGNWRALLHPATLDYFERINGPARFREANL